MDASEVEYDFVHVRAFTYILSCHVRPYDLLIHLCFLICLYVPILLCFLGQLSHLPYSSWHATRIKGAIMSLVLHYWMGDAHHCSGPAVSEMTYTV